MPRPWHSPPRCRRLACAFEQSRLSPQQVAQAYELLVPIVRRRLPGSGPGQASARPGGGDPFPYPARLGGTAS
jgi:hypothetical protein